MDANFVDITILKKLINIDGIGEDPSSSDITLLRTYISNSTNSDGATVVNPGLLYEPIAASTSINQSEVNVTGLGHVIATGVRVREYPNYTFTTDEYVKPFFTIYEKIAGSDKNIFDTFSKFGRKMTCKTNQNQK